MPANIGPKIGIDGEQKYKQQMAQIIQQAKTLDSEMKLLTSSFDKNAAAEYKDAKQGEVLAKQISTQKDKISLLSDMLKRSSELYGDNDTRTLKWKEQLNKANTELNEMQKDGKDATRETKNLGSAMNTSTKSANKIEEGVEDVGEALEDSGNSASVFGEMLKANLTSQAIIGGIKSVASACWEIGKAMAKAVAEAVNSFAELQQNLGGSEAVFGQYAEDLQKISETAYKTMGTTQSEYLATANKMGALFQGSGVEMQRSLELTTQAMQRAADMASVMGIDTESALEAITGAAKGNYTMMDNLGVAMNATTLSAYALDKGFDKAFSQMSNAEKAEVAMQYFFENTEQYANNFANEAATTVSGSIGQLKAAVETWVAGLGNSEADITQLTMNIVDAFETAVENVVPVVQNVINALPQVIEAALPAIQELLPTVLEAGISVMESLILGLWKALPKIAAELPRILTSVIEFILTALPEVVDAAFTVIETLAAGIAKALPKLIPAAIQCVVKLVQTIIEHLPKIIAMAMELVKGMAQGIIEALPILLEALPELITGIVNTVLEAIPLIIDTGTELLSALLDNADYIIGVWVDALPKLIEGLIEGIMDNLPKIMEAGFKLMSALMDKLPAVIEYYITQAFPTFWKSIFDYFAEKGPDFAEQGGKLLMSLGEKWGQIFSKLWNTIKGYGGQLLKGLWEGMKSVKDWLWSKVKNMLHSLTDKIKGFFGIHSPSRLFEDEIGANLAKGIGVGFKDEMPDVTRGMNKAMPTTLNTTNMGGITINVQGAPGQNVNELATIVAQKIQTQVNRRGAVYA